MSSNSIYKIIERIKARRCSSQRQGARTIQEEDLFAAEEGWLYNYEIYLNRIQSDFRHRLLQEDEEGRGIPLTDAELRKPSPAPPPFLEPVEDAHDFVWRVVKTWVLYDREWYLGPPLFDLPKKATASTVVSKDAEEVSLDQ